MSMSMPTGDSELNIYARCWTAVYALRSEHSEDRRTELIELLRATRSDVEESPIATALSMLSAPDEYSDCELGSAIDVLLNSALETDCIVNLFETIANRKESC